jgi:transcriptional regulator with XRE-family HTH domain
VSLSIGGRLKSAREAKGLSLGAVAKITKIQRSILEAIEIDRLEDLLDPVYVKIFLKRYAGFLGLDGSALLEEYAALHGLVPEHPLTPQAEAAKVATSHSWRQMLAPVSVGVAALVGLSFLGYLAVDLYGTLKGPGRPGTQAKKVSGTDAFKPRPDTRQSSQLLIPRSQPLKLTVRTKADVWMQVKADGGVIFQNVLPKGAKESWTAKDELELWTGNASAMELALNGKPLEGVGRGVKKGIKVTHRGLYVPE